MNPRSIKLPNEATSFGRANRPQTPVKGIILGAYGETAREQLQQRYAAMRAMSPNSQKHDIKFTKTALRREEFNKTMSAAFDKMKADDQKLFKLKRFQNVEHRVVIAKPGKQ